MAGCALVGGETAEMPGTYGKNKFDLAGFAVGVVSRKNLLTKTKIKKNDIVMAIPSSGLHSNGYTLVRNILKKRKKLNLYPNLKSELIKPTKIYVKEIIKLNKRKLINGASHITGGGLVNNLVRVIPYNLSLNIDLSKIKIKPIFKWLKKSNVKDNEMLKTFNCGVGFCIIINKKNINKIKKVFSKEYQPYTIGFISKSKSKINTYGRLRW